MTVNQSDRKSGPYVSDGAQLVYSFDFKIKVDSDLEVWVQDNSVDPVVEKKLALTSDYTVTEKTSTGGEITLAVAEAANNVILILGRSAVDQQTVVHSGEAIFSVETQDTLDQTVRLVQEVDEASRRKLGFSVFSTADDVELPTPATEDVGKVITVKSEAPIEYEYTPATDLSAGTISPYAAQLLAAADAPAANAILLNDFPRQIEAFFASDRNVNFHVPYKHYFLGAFVMLGEDDNGVLSMFRRVDRPSDSTLMVPDWVVTAGAARTIFTSDVVAGEAAVIQPANQIYRHVATNAPTGFVDVTVGIYVKPAFEV